MRPVFGSESTSRGVGEMVRFPHNAVVVEGHNVFAKDFFSTVNHTSLVQYESFDVAPYLYVDARHEWMPLSETFRRKLWPRNTEAFDSTTCIHMKVEATDVRHHVVAFLDESIKFDDETEDFARMQRKISLYAMRYGTWEERGVLEGPVVDDSLPTFWGADFALSAKAKTLAVSIMDGKDVGKIHLYKFDLNTDKWNAFDEQMASPLEGSSLAFGWSVQMNEDGDAVAGVGCNVDDNTDEDEVHCYFQAFHKSTGLAHDRSNLWSNMGEEVDCSDMDLQPEDQFLMVSGGKSIVLGTVDYDKECPISKEGGKVRVYEYDELKDRWLPKGQDLDSLFDFSTAEKYSIQPSSIGNHGDMVTLYVFWVDKKLGKQSLLFTCEFQQGRWELIGLPVHVGDFGSSSLSPDGEKLVVGAQFDANYLGSLRLFNMYHDHNDDTKPGYPATKRPKSSALSRYARGLARRQHELPHLRSSTL